MKKTLFSIALVLGLIGSASKSEAHDGRLSIGAELGIPMGDFADFNGIGIGGTIRYEAPVGDNLGITGTAGYLSFSGKDFTVAGFTFKGESTYLIPVQAGAKYYFDQQQEGLYGHVMVGVHMYKTTEATVDPVTFAITTKDKMKAALSYAPEIGYHMENIDIGLRYQIYSISADDGLGGTKTKSYSYLGLRLAYVLGGR